jgi:hypothetical protein
MKNKTGYSTLKVRLFISLMLIGSYAYLGTGLWDKYHHAGMIAFPALLIVTFCIAWMMSPIKVQHHGVEQSV